MSAKKIMFVCAGSLFLIFGAIGIVLPILPTTPFWLLTLACYSRGSTRFHLWFTQSKMYEKHLKSFYETRIMTRVQKWRLMIFVDSLMFVSFLMVEPLYLKLLLVTLVAIKHWYFHRYVILIPSPLKKGRISYDSSS